MEKKESRELSYKLAVKLLNITVRQSRQSGEEYPKVCVNLQTDVRYNYSVWRLFLWQEEKTAHKKQQ